MGPLRWASDGQKLYILFGVQTYLVDVSRPESMEAVALPRCSPNPGRLDVSSDGSRVVCADYQSTPDAWLIRNFDPAAPPRRP